MAIRLGLVTEAFIDRPLEAVMDWLVRAAPQITDLEIGAGCYAPPGHCDRAALLADGSARQRWLDAIERRGLRVGALNAWGNPLHPQIGAQHDAELRETIRLAAELGVDRIVAMAGCPGAADGDPVPHFAGGGWLPYLEGIYEWQWEARIEPYWSELSAFALREHPQLVICLELHPGTVAHNVDTFERLAALGDNLAANIDPSHFFWQHMDTEAIVGRLGGRVGHAHAKDLAFQAEHLALNGLLDQRWPHDPERLPWNFATVGEGHDADWWSAFTGWLAPTAAHTIAIEHEDPFVPAEEGVVRAAEALSPPAVSA
jgi:sugar phosphate isomerase/epimerase